MALANILLLACFRRLDGGGLRKVFFVSLPLLHTITTTTFSSSSTINTSI